MVRMCHNYKSLKRYQFILLFLIINISVIQEKSVVYTCSIIWSATKYFSKNHIFSETCLSELSYNELGFTDQNSVPLEIENDSKLLMNFYYYYNHKHQLSHGSEYNMANIFRVSHILLTYFASLQAREIKAKYEKRGKYWPYCAR